MWQQGRPYQLARTSAISRYHVVTAWRDDRRLPPWRRPPAAPIGHRTPELRAQCGMHHIWESTANTGVLVTNATSYEDQRIALIAS